MAHQGFIEETLAEDQHGAGLTIILTYHPEADVLEVKSVVRPSRSAKRLPDAPPRKPLIGDSSESRPSVGHRSGPPTGSCAKMEPQKYAGGRLTFGPVQIRLCGEVITERTERGNSWAVLHRLRERHLDGRFKPAKARELADLFKSGKATQNTVSSCIGKLRTRITEVMANAGWECGPQDVILSGGPGYRLREWIETDETGEVMPYGDIVGTDTHLDVTKPVPLSKADDSRVATRTAVESQCGDTAGTNVHLDVTENVPAHVPAKPVNVPLNNRQQWVLDQLRRGARLERERIERQFNVADKTAKRDLRGLVERGLIEFIRVPKPGHYRLSK